MTSELCKKCLWHHERLNVCILDGLDLSEINVVICTTSYEDALKVLA